MLHIAHLYPRLKEIHGGGELVLIQLLNELTALGHRNTLCTVSLPDEMREALDDDVTIRTLPSACRSPVSHFLLQGLCDLALSPALFARAPRRVDAVCFHTEGVVPALLFRQPLRTGRPCMYFCYQPPRFVYDTQKSIATSGGLVARLLPAFAAAYRGIDRVAVRRADSVLTFSTDYKRWIESLYGISDVQVLAPGVRRPREVPPLPASVRDRLLGGKARTIVFSGKLIPQKCLGRLINAVAIASKRIDRLRCLIVGDGPSLKALEEQVDSMGLRDTVLFCGFVGTEEVYSYYDASELLVILDRNVSFGLCITEAQACGVPTMAFASGGPADIIEDGETGILLSLAATDEQIATRLTNCLLDRVELERMGANARRSAQRFSWRAFARGFAAIAERIAQRGPSFAARPRVAGSAPMYQAGREGG